MNIDSFSGEYRWLSNFWFCPVTLDGIVYPSTEHAYQAAKFDDPKMRDNICKAATFKQAKHLGYAAGLRLDWELVKLKVMEDLLRQKFKPGSDLAVKLISTQGRKLIEGNTWGDTFWGICKGKGHNHLGKLLMKIREELIKGQ
jgi:ribA/ribD-fused uncharacterized protein